MLYGFVMAVLSAVLPTWNVWPQTLLDGINTFANSFMKLDFIFPIHETFIALEFLIGFEAVYYTAKIVFKGIHLFTGKKIDI